MLPNHGTLEGLLSHDPPLCAHISFAVPLEHEVEVSTRLVSRAYCVHDGFAFTIHDLKAEQRPANGTIWNASMDAKAQSPFFPTTYISTTGLGIICPVHICTCSASFPCCLGASSSRGWKGQPMSSPHSMALYRRLGHRLPAHSLFHQSPHSTAHYGHISCPFHAGHPS